jgi:cytoskeletal protein RodZ
MTKVAMLKNAETISRFSTEQDVVSEGRELTFGQYFRRELTLRGISSEEIIRVTKISAEYCHALQNDRADHLPHKAFVVGLLRVVARYAGLDSDELVNRFLAQMNTGVIASPHVPDPGFLKKNWKKLCFTFGALSLLILMFLPLL